MTAVKVCSKCMEEKAISEFYSGRLVCKNCFRSIRKDRYNSDPEKEKLARNLARNPNFMSKKKLTLEEKKENHRLASKAYKEKNPIRTRADRTKRRALERGCIIKLTLDEWQQILEEYSYQCAYCSNPWEHMDHFIPLSKGGTHTADNVVPACSPCNLSKGKKMPLDWINS